MVVDCRALFQLKCDLMYALLVRLCFIKNNFKSIKPGASTYFFSRRGQGNNSIKLLSPFLALPLVARLNFIAAIAKLYFCFSRAQYSIAIRIYVFHKRRNFIGIYDLLSVGKTKILSSASYYSFSRRRCRVDSN